MGSLPKSWMDRPPTALAIWSIRPLGLPKNTFSAYWLMRAFSCGSITQPLYSASNTPTSMTSSAADEDRPLPLNTVLVTLASKPPTL